MEHLTLRPPRPRFTNLLCYAAGVLVEVGAIFFLMVVAFLIGWLITRWWPC